MRSKLESDVCCHLQVAPSGESYGGNRRLGRNNQKVTAAYCQVYGVIHVTCGLTACVPCTPGSAPGPTLGNEYGKTSPLDLLYLSYRRNNVLTVFDNVAVFLCI